MATGTLISAISASQNIAKTANLVLVNFVTTKTNELALTRSQKLSSSRSGAALKLPEPGGGSAIVAQEIAQDTADKKARGKTADKNNETRLGELSDEEKAVVARLKKTDRTVRAHERAHKVAGGPFTGAARLQFVTGPDGRRYAVSGEVPIDASEVPGNPDATIRKLETVRRAALAPAQPSAQDRRVAAIAQQGIAEARAEKRAQRAENNDADGKLGAALPPATISADTIALLAEAR
jgi:SprA-related family